MDIRVRGMVGCYFTELQGKGERYIEVFQFSLISPRGERPSSPFVFLWFYSSCLVR